jgi:hypothetical protein
MIGKTRENRIGWTPRRDETAVGGAAQQEPRPRNNHGGCAPILLTRLRRSVRPQQQGFFEREG